MQNLLKYCVAAVAFCAAGGLPACAATFTTDPVVWAALHPDQESFALSASDVLKSDEITSLPTNESTSPGPNLTFPSSATGVHTSFQLHSQTPWPWTYRSNLGGPYGGSGLSSA